MLHIVDIPSNFSVTHLKFTNFEGGKAKQPQNQLKLNGLAAPMKRQPTSYNNAGYSRYDQERFGQSKEENHLGFSLQTQATYHGNSLKAVMVSCLYALKIILVDSLNKTFLCFVKFSYLS